jgi:hypothetical protein
MANNAKELSVEEVSDSLSEFQRRFAQLPDIEEPPQTFLHLLGQESEETDWNTILSYFLDPSEPHGYGTDLLEAFLSLLEKNSELDFDFDRLDFGELAVKSEWVMRTEANIEPRPDITIYSGRNWFVIVEMKVHSSETNNQTWLYVCSDRIGTIDKSEFGEPEDEEELESGENKQYLEDQVSHNYVYLAPEIGDTANAPHFANISWREVVEALGQFEYQSHGRYPAKSHAQLSDFLDTVRRELNMTDKDFEENQMEKLRLYAQHADEIDNARGAFDEWQESIGDGEWKERFRSDFEPASWSDRWRADPSGFGHIYRADWQIDDREDEGWRQTENRNFTTDKDDSEYRIDFVHKPQNREMFRQGRLTFQIYCPKMAAQDFTDEFSERFHNDESVSKSLQKQDITQKNGAKMWHTEKIYPFDPEELPDSYYQTLQTAFEEHQEIADHITRIFEATLDEIE